MGVATVQRATRLPLPPAPGASYPVARRGLPASDMTAPVCFQGCPKCGVPDPYVKYRPHQCFLFDSDKARVTADVVVAHEGEHFHAECPRCDYQWQAGMDGSRR